MPVHKHSFQVHPSQDYSGCEIKPKGTSLQKCGNHSYAERWQGSVRGTHGALGPAHGEGSAGQGQGQC